MIGQTFARMAATLLATALLIPAIAGAAAPEIEYAYPDQSVWTTRLDARGNPDNPLLRLAAVLFDKAGIPWHGRDYPAARLFTSLNDGTAQFSMLVKAPALQACCLVSRAPVASTELRAYRTAGRPPIRTPEDLAGKRIITIRGYSYGELASILTDPRYGIVNHSAVKHEAAFSMLEAGRADYLLDYAGPAAEVLAAQPIPGLTFDVVSRLSVYFVLSRGYPDAPSVMDRLEAILATLNVEDLIGPAARPADAPPVQ